MSRDASITLAWADGDYHFRLAWGELKLLQEATNAGPPIVLKRLENDLWLIEDISSVIRCGLIGGGMTPVQALKLTRAYVESRPPAENVPYAIAILQCGLFGAPDEDETKKDEGRMTATDSMISQTENSGLEPSMARAQ